MDKLTHWVNKELKDKVLKGKGIPRMKRDMTMKPNGFWLSVNNSWEEWIEGNWEGWLEGKVCLEAELSEDINLFIIDSKQIFLKEFKKLTGHDYLKGNIIERITLTKFFHEKLKEYYDGVWLKEEPFWKHRMDLDFMYFYSWDCESIVVWNKDKIKFKEVK